MLINISILGLLDGPGIDLSGLDGPTQQVESRCVGQNKAEQQTLGLFCIVGPEHNLT